MTVYYNEIDNYCSQWLRNLIKAKLIADGDVDTRDIRDVRPNDLRGYTQCHFFAGVGVWSYALRLAGWPDDRPVWTGSCPCQPFSAAGQGLGFADERHLWPAFFHLIAQRKPASILGEQVASKDADAWIDLVQADMEALGYPFGAVPFPSCSVGGPHKRDRLYWVANSDKQRGNRTRSIRQTGRIEHSNGSKSCELGDAIITGLEGFARNDSATRRQGQSGSTAKAGCLGSMEHANMPEQNEWTSSGKQSLRDERNAELGGMVHTESEQAWISRFARESGATRGYWSAADWIPCRDGYWRPVQPGTFPLAHGVANRMGKTRAYGNAINAEQAKVFIETVM